MGGDGDTVSVGFEVYEKPRVVSRGVGPLDAFGAFY